MMAVDAEGKGVFKCDLCIHRQAEGKQPACVDACPTHALSFEEEQVVNRSKRRQVALRMVKAQEAGEEELGE
jgi:Fe-S-cluster-containing dehydrogenase component